MTSAPPPVAGARVARGHRPQRPPHARSRRAAAVPHRPPRREPPDHPRHAAPPAPTPASSSRTASTVLEDCDSRHGTFVNGKRITRHALQQLRPDRFRRAGLLPARVRARRRGAEAPDGAGGRAREAGARRTGVGGNLAKLRADSRSGAHAAKLLLDRRRAGVGGGYGAGDHRRGARLPAAARRRWAGDARRAARAAATISTRATCACRAK